jgi:hypothetical protein
MELYRDRQCVRESCFVASMWHAKGRRACHTRRIEAHEATFGSTHAIKVFLSFKIAGSITHICFWGHHSKYITDNSSIKNSM